MITFLKIIWVMQSISYNNYFLEWPCMTCKWGPLTDKTEDYFRQKIYFSCRTDGIYTESDNYWKQFAGFLVVAVVGNLTS